MQPATNHTLVEVLYAALRSEAGLVLRTDDPARLRQKLYQTRRALNDSDLDILRFIASRADPENELMVVKDASKVQS